LLAKNRERPYKFVENTIEKGGGSSHHHRKANRGHMQQVEKRNWRGRGGERPKR